LLNTAVGKYVVAFRVLNGRVHLSLTTKLSGDLSVKAQGELVKAITKSFGITDAEVTLSRNTVSFILTSSPGDIPLALIPAVYSEEELERITLYLQGKRGADLEIAVNEALNATEAEQYDKAVAWIRELLGDDQVLSGRGGYENGSRRISTGSRCGIALYTRKPFENEWLFSMESNMSNLAWNEAEGYAEAIARRMASLIAEVVATLLRDRFVMDPVNEAEQRSRWTSQNPDSSAERRMIRARRTCLSGRLRSLVMASKRSRSSVTRMTLTVWAIPQTRTNRRVCESYVCVSALGAAGSSVSAHFRLSLRSRRRLVHFVGRYPAVMPFVKAQEELGRFVHELGLGDAPIAFIVKIPKIGFCENRAGIFDDLELFLVDVAAMVSIRAIEEISDISSPLVAAIDAKIAAPEAGRRQHEIVAACSGARGLVAALSVGHSDVCAEQQGKHTCRKDTKHSCSLRRNGRHEAHNRSLFVGN
jgi:hypothetical protein